MRRFTRYIAVASMPGQVPRFCGHLHRSAHRARSCAARMRLRLPGATVDVASTWDCDGDPCPIVDFHKPGMTCPLCGMEG